MHGLIAELTINECINSTRKIATIERKPLRYFLVFSLRTTTSVDTSPDVLSVHRIPLLSYEGGINLWPDGHNLDHTIVRHLLIERYVPECLPCSASDSA